MAWPPPTMVTNRTNSTVMTTTHPAEHNAVNLAINDIVARIDTDLLRASVSVLPWATAIPAGRKWIIQTTPYNGFTAANGTITIPYPTPFPAGVAFVFVGAVSVAAYYSLAGRTAVSLSSATVYAFAAGSAGALGTTQVDAQLIAIGW